MEVLAWLVPLDTDWAAAIPLALGAKVFFFKPGCVPDEYRFPDFEGTVVQVNVAGLVGRVGDPRRGQEPSHVLNASLWAEGRSVLFRDHTTSAVAQVNRGGRLTDTGIRGGKRYKGKVLRWERGFLMRKDDFIVLGEAIFRIASFR